MAPNASKPWQRHREPMVFSPDPRPGADSFVYCKGCGHPLESRDRVSHRRVAITAMMCDACREVHGHDLVPASGARTFCYRCGEQEEVFVTMDFAPITYHLCGRCLPERAERYRKGDFNPPEPPETAGA